MHYDDSVARVSLNPPPLNHAANILLISKRSTSDPMPEDTFETRKTGWEKTALLLSYFFPEHEEPDPKKFGVVTWTEGWHENFSRLAGRLVCPPVVRTLLYSQNPREVRRWVDRVSGRWEFERIIPAHWEAPVRRSSIVASRGLPLLPLALLFIWRCVVEEILRRNAVSVCDDGSGERDVTRECTGCNGDMTARCQKTYRDPKLVVVSCGLGMGKLSVVTDDCFTFFSNARWN